MCQSIYLTDAENRMLHKDVNNLMKKEFEHFSNFNAISSNSFLISAIDYLINHNIKYKKILEEHKGFRGDVCMALVSAIPRFYCIAKCELKTSHLFNSVKEMLYMCPELKSFKCFERGDINWLLGFNKTSSGKIEEKRERYMIKKVQTNEEPLNFLTTENKTKLMDLSPLLFDFVLQKEKKLYTFDAGTGLGKSYSISSFIAQTVKNTNVRDKISRTFYITDRKNNVIQEMNDLIKRFPDVKDEVLYLPSVEDGYINNIESFKNLFSELYTSNREDNAIKNAHKNLEENVEKIKTQNDKSYKEYLRNDFISKESIYRTLLKAKLSKIFKEKGLKNYKDKVDFIKRKYPLLLQIYPAILLKEKRIIFLTVDKFYFTIDTIIEKSPVTISTDSAILKNSVLFVDESDAAAGIFLNKICDDSTKTEIDILEKTRMFYGCVTSVNPKNEFITDEIIKIISEIEENYGELKTKYYINFNYEIDNIEDIKEDRWLFVKNSTKIIQAKDSSIRFIITHDKNGFNRLTFEGEGTEEEKVTLYTDFVKLLIKTYILIKKLIKRTAEMIYEKYNGTLTIQQCLQRAFSMYNISDDQDSRESLIKEMSIHRGKSTQTFVAKDFYAATGLLISTTVSDDEPDNVKIRSYTLQNSPENFILYMLNSGAHIVLSSATAANKSRFRNFNLEWPALGDALYKDTEHAKQLLIDYRNRREKNIDKFNLSLNITEEYEGIKSDVCELTQKIFDSLPTDVSKDEYDGERRSLKEGLNDLLCGITNSSSNKNESSILYYQAEYLTLVYDCIQKIHSDSKMNLMLTKFAINDERIKDGIAKILRHCGGHGSISAFFADSSSLIKIQEEMQKKMDGNSTFFLFSAYATAEKGLNLIFDIPRETYEKSKYYKNNLIPLNDNGENILKSEKDIKTDLTGVYLGSITHVTPEITFEKGKKDSSILQSIYYAESLYYNNNRKADSMIGKVLQVSDSNNCNNNPFNKEHSQEAYSSYCASVIACVSQAVGRCGRCDVRIKNKFITINSNIIQKLKSNKFELENIIDNDTFEKQSNDVRQVLTFIDEKVNDSSKERDVRGRVERANSKIRKAICENFENANAKPLINIHKHIKSLVLPADAYNELTDDIKCFYIDEKNFMTNGYSYKYDGEDSYGNKNVTKIMPIGDEQNKVSVEAMHLTNKQRELLTKNGIDLNMYLDCEEKYILLPCGFDILLGNIGECLAINYLNGINIYPEKLPEEIYETMDLIKEFDDYVLAIDAKYYRVHKKEYDDVDTNNKRYSDKLNKIQKFYNKKVIGVVLNTRNISSDEYKVSQYSLENGNMLITVPNIFTDGSYSPQVMDQLSRLLSGFCEFKEETA